MKVFLLPFFVICVYAAGPTCNAGWPSTSIPVTISGRFVHPGNSYRSGSAVTLSSAGSSSGDGSGLTYQWSQIANLTTGIASAVINGLPSTSANPVINVHSTLAAPLDLSLTVTDVGDHLSATCYISDGVVPTSDTGTVIVPANVAKIIGNPVAFQQDPWPFRDTATGDVLATFSGTYDLFQTGSPVPYTAAPGSGGWNTASTHGVISSITNYTTGTCPVSDFGQGCFGLNGSGTTQFDTDYCGGPGGTNLSNFPNIIIWYNTGRGAETGRMMVLNGHCSGAHTLYAFLGDLYENQSIGSWPGDSTASWSSIAMSPVASQTNLSYSSIYTSGTSTPGTGWYFTGVPPYYDPGAMFYEAYYRSGIDVWLWDARAWVDAAWSGPFFDRGQTFAFGNAPGCVNAENCYALDFGGLVLRAMDNSDGHLDMWAGLAHIYFWNASYLTHNSWPQDARISGTAAMVIAYGALLDQNVSGYSTTWCPNCSTLYPTLGSMSWPQFLRTAIHTTIGSFWGPGEDSAQHGWLGFIGYYSGGGGGFTSYDGGRAWSGKLATISTSGGVSTVTCTGCTWSAAMFANKFDPTNGSTTPCSSGAPCSFVPIIFGPSGVGHTNSGSSDWDNQAYCQPGCTFNAGTGVLTLDRVYANGPGNYNWATAVDNTGAISPGTPYTLVSGWGQNGFMGGLVVAGLLLSSQACVGTPAGCSSGDDTTLAGYASDETNWLINYGQTANTYGLSYMVGYPACVQGQSTPVAVAATNYVCLTSINDAVYNREIMGDSSTGMIRSFIANPNSALRTWLDNWYAGMWGKSGVGSPPIPSPDGNWDTQFDADRTLGCVVNLTYPYITGCTNIGGNNGYWISSVGAGGASYYLSQKLGAQHFGISNEDTWPPVRLLGVPVASRPSVQ